MSVAVSFFPGLLKCLVAEFYSFLCSGLTRVLLVYNIVGIGVCKSKIFLIDYFYHAAMWSTFVR